MPLLWLSIAFLAGILLAANIGLPIAAWHILAGGLAALTGIRFFLARLNVRPIPLSASLAPRLPVPLPLPIPIPILALVLTLGALRYQASLPDLSDPQFIAHYNDTVGQMAVTGVVAAFPDGRDAYTNIRLETERLRPDSAVIGTPVHGLMLARVAPEEELRYGDRVVLRGELQTPPEHQAFSYRDYLARQGIYSYMPRSRLGVLETGQGNPFMRGVLTLKARALETVFQLWPDPEASLLAGILLGVEARIPKPVQEAFKETGTSHVIAISGFNNPVSQIVHPRYHQVSLQ